LARELAHGKSVLDIACGEGYGSDLLAAVAAQVIGVDLSEEAIAHARRKYGSRNLQFRLGSCSRIPVGDASIDLVVSFETIEHHAQHDEMMREIKRVLRPDGLLVMSSPDRYQYSDVPGHRSPYHVRELYLDELCALLGRFFRNRKLYGQGVRFASVVGPLDDKLAHGGFMTFHNEGGAAPVAEHGMAKPTYHIALASDGILCDLPAGVYAGQDERFVKLEAHVATLQEALEAAQATVTGGEARAISLQSELDSAHVSLAAERTRAAALQSELEDARAGLDDVQRQISRLGARLETAEARLADRDAALKALEDRLEAERSLRVEADALREELARRTSEVEKVRERVEARLQEEAEQRASELALLQREAHVMRTSKSWRLTQPMRDLVKFARPLRGALRRRSSVVEHQAAVRDRGILRGILDREVEFLGPYFRSAGLLGPPASICARLREAGWPVYDSHESAESVAAVIRTSDLFDGAEYRARLGKLNGLDPALHYVVVGEATGVSPSKDFDPAYYRERYPDVAQARLNCLAHYVYHGRREGRRPLSAAAGLQFDRSRIDPKRGTIVLVTHEASRTGAPILAYNVARQLQSKYNVVGLLLADGELSQEFEKVCAAVVGPLCQEHWNDVEAKHLVNHLTASYEILFAVVNSIESRIVLPALGHALVPVTALVHEFASYTRPEGAMGRALDWATQVVFSAEIVAHAAHREHPTLGGRMIHVLRQGRCDVPAGPNGDTRVSTAGDLSRAFRPKGSEDALVVLGCGAVHIRKGVDLFISCAASVAALRTRRPVRFVWIGHGYDPRKDAAYSAYLAEQIVNSGVEEIVTILDAVADLEPAYSAADMFFLSSRLDPLPNVTIEAAWRGMPVICFAGASGMAEVLAQDTATRQCVIPHLDVTSAARVIAAFADDEGARIEAGDATRRRAREVFDMGRYVDQIEKLGLESVHTVRQRREDFESIRNNPAFDVEIYTAPGYPCANREDAIVRFLAQWTAVGMSRQAASNGLFRRPCAGFNPQVYAHDHAGQYDTATVNPFVHFIRSGKPSGRWLSSMITPSGAGRASAPRASPRVALHAHIYFPELAAEFMRKLAANRGSCDLLLSTDSEAKAEILRDATARYRRGETEIRVVPNRGRDVGPLLTVFADAAANEYDIIGHLHAKRSLTIGDGTLGNTWREFLWQNLLGDSHPMMDVIVDSFAADEKLGLVFAADPHVSDWDSNLELATALAGRMGIEEPLPPFFDFPIGSMFWARSKALKPLFELKLQWEDYPEEPLPEDGTILHAIERLLPFAARRAGYGFAATHVPGVTW
jgi:glycosyltransferase involved in cell wall biosynthesis/SAM-dependent methyltransferase